MRLGSVIPGELARPVQSRMLHSRNPANLGEVVAELELADAATFVRACRAARDGQPAWAGPPPPLRGRVIQQVGRLVEANKQALAALLTREIGKPWRESLGEVQEVVDTCTFFLGEGRRLYGQTVPSELADKQLFTFRRPLGVAPWSSPPTSRWRCRPGTSCRRCCAATRWRLPTFSLQEPPGPILVLTHAGPHLAGGSGPVSPDPEVSSGDLRIDLVLRPPRVRRPLTELEVFAYASGDRQAEHGRPAEGRQDYSGKLQKAQMDVVEPSSDPDFRLDR